MMIYLCSLGCARNQVDSEAMLGSLAAAGHGITRDPEAADVIVVNTCGFIEAATEEAIDTILELARYKEAGSCRKLIVAGCLPERYRDHLAAELPEVDIFLGTGAYDRIVAAVDGLLPPNSCHLPSPDTLPLHTHMTMRVQDTFPLAYLKIMEGCNRHCTYCIIPKLRGRLRSRPTEDIVREAEALAEAGFKEIVIIGQDTTSYGCDFDPPVNFAKLLHQVAQRVSNVRLRFLYGHPDRIEDELLQTISAHINVCSYFDVPIQHVSQSVLKRMGRRQDAHQLRGLFERIRSAVPDAALRTTVMVGFPGETEADFAELLDFVEAVKFDHLGAFIYSDADDLPSHALPDHVPEDVARDRLDRLMRLQADISSENNQNKIGNTYCVLIEEKESEGVYTGRTFFQAPEVDGITVVFAENLEIGQYQNVRITDATEYDLEGVPA